MKKVKSGWRSVRVQEGQFAHDLRKRHWLRLHGMCIGLTVLGVMWATSHLQMVLGSESMAIRYLVTLGVGYVAYLLVLRLWAGALVGRGSDAGGDGADVLDAIADVPGPSLDGVRLPELSPVLKGGGGDFGGGGASGDFSGGADLLGDVAGGAVDVIAGSDEGAVVVVPVVAVFLIGCALLFGTGALLLLYFGFDALLAVAVELAFGYVSARTAVRMAREGWLSAAVRLTWKPLLGALFCAVLLGATMDYFIPTAQSLPQALQMIRALR
ncbi:MAG: hypothetical protein EOO25_03330 [Comamonadaceae bacterium]|nr:MAG: hypothetical protein EOO25_03330 [Comamonadaceae bacterium]